MQWAFGDFVLDSETYGLRRDQSPLSVEPRVFDLLAYLIQHRDRVVSKDELLVEVWQGQHVSESALTRCIYEARRVLGDDAERQQLVKTVYGRGYQFVAPVRELVDRSEPEAADSGSEAEPSRRRTSRRGGYLLAWLGGGVLLLVGLLAWSGREPVSVTTSLPSRSPPVELESGTVERLMIVPFTADASIGDPGLIALSVSDQLWYRLAAQPGLVLRALEVGAALEAVGLLPSAMLTEAQVDAVVTGRLESAALGGGLELTVQLHELDAADNPRTLTVGTYEVPRVDSKAELQGFLRVRDAIAEDVVEHLRPTFAVRDPAGISPHDPEALRLYLQARERFATITCGDAEVLIDLLDRSLEIDPGFASAWVAKGFALYSQSWSCGREAAFAEQALAAARKGRELAPEFPGAVLLEVTLLSEAGRSEEAYELLLEGWRPIESSPLTHMARAYVLTYAGFLDEAAGSIERALRLDPLVLSEFSIAPTSMLYRGDVDRFLKVAPAGDTPQDRYYRGVALLRQQRFAEALQRVEPAFRLNPSDLFARFASALTAVLEDDDVAALEIVRGIVRQRRELGSRDGELTFKEAQLFAWAGSDPEALDRLEAAVDGGFFCARCIAEEPAFANLSQDARFQALLETASGRHRQFGERFGLTIDL